MDRNNFTLKRLNMPENIEYQKGAFIGMFSVLAHSILPKEICTLIAIFTGRPTAQHAGEVCKQADTTGKAWAQRLIDSKSNESKEASAKNSYSLPASYTNNAAIIPQQRVNPTVINHSER
jgi:hypothetical protein